MHLDVVRLPQSFVVRVLVVVQDDLLVHRVDAHTPKNPFAAPRPAASAIGGVPASYLCGGTAQVEPAIVTSSIISPPPRNGGSASSSEYGAHSTPIPVGPSILCPVNATASTPRACTSIPMCGTDCEASRTTAAPTLRAFATTTSTGLIVPSRLD